MITALAKRRDGTLLIASHYGLYAFDPRSGILSRGGPRSLSTAQSPQ
jgi:hypothetical protein